MSQQELLAKVIRTLEQLGIECMVTGSIASSMQGEPRSTHDIGISGGSEKQFIDAVRVYEVQYEKLDHKYLREWTKNLSIENEMERLRNEAKTENL
jgi:hypothetical protein